MNSRLTITPGMLLTNERGHLRKIIRQFPDGRWEWRSVKRERRAPTFDGGLASREKLREWATGVVEVTCDSISVVPL